MAYSETVPLHYLEESANSRQKNDNYGVRGNIARWAVNCTDVRGSDFIGPALFIT